VTVQTASDTILDHLRIILFSFLVSETQTIPKSKGRILCSEDDADSRELMIFVLRQEGYEVIATKNSTDALAPVKLERFDLILVDDWMRGLSGPDLTRQIRLIQTLPSFFTPERRSNPTSKRPTMPAPKAISQSR